MALLGIDLGGTKAAFALVSNDGKMLSRDIQLLHKRKGKEVGELIAGKISDIVADRKRSDDPVESAGISVPGIYHSGTGTVWAPNIEGWEDYPLHAESAAAAGDIPLIIDSDRACSVAGEIWQGKARSCRDVIFIAVGTGIGAGIAINGEILRGSGDIAGAAGWMGIDGPFIDKYSRCGFLEYYASGTGMARSAAEYIEQHSSYAGSLRRYAPDTLSAALIFEAYDSGDEAAIHVIDRCIRYWGMAAANMISLFNPQKLIFGGGIFGPAAKFIPAITEEAEKWAQPVSMKYVSIEISALSGDAPLYGSCFLALKNMQKIKTAG